MRIAVTGTHRVGKTSLVEALAEKLGYASVPEPYRLLEDEGVEIDGVSVEDFEMQLEKSIDVLAETEGDDVVFDRCPLDFVAYLRALGYDIDPELVSIEKAMETIELVVVVRIESPDRIAVSADDDRELRRTVDVLIERMVGGLGEGIEIVEVEGTIDERVAQVLAALR